MAITVGNRVWTLILFFRHIDGNHKLIRVKLVIHRGGQVVTACYSYIYRKWILDFTPSVIGATITTSSGLGTGHHLFHMCSNIQAHCRNQLRKNSCSGVHDDNYGISLYLEACTVVSHFSWFCTIRFIGISSACAVQSGQWHVLFMVHVLVLGETVTVERNHVRLLRRAPLLRWTADGLPKCLQTMYIHSCRGASAVGGARLVPVWFWLKWMP